MLVKLSNKDAIVPVRGSEAAAGWDLFSCAAGEIAPGESAFVAIGISLKIPDGHYGQISGRSSIMKRDIYTFPGVIDADYIGEIKVCMKNWSKETFKYEKHQRIAQIIILKHAEMQMEIVDVLPDTKRGENGFGSTGTGILQNVTSAAI